MVTVKWNYAQKCPDCIVMNKGCASKGTLMHAILPFPPLQHKVMLCKDREGGRRTYDGDVFVWSWKRTLISMEISIPIIVCREY